MLTGCFIGIDQGSSATKAVAISTDGQVLFQVRKILPPPFRGGNRIEHDAEEILRSISDALNESIQTVQGSGVRVLGIGLSCQRSSCLAWNGSTGAPLTPVISWRDARGSDLIENLRDQGPDILQRSGLPLTPYYSASKLRWIRDTMAEARQPEAVYGTLSSLLVRHLTGNNTDVIDHTHAARTQLMNIGTLAWDEELIRTLRLDRHCASADRTIGARLRDRAYPGGRLSPACLSRRPAGGHARARRVRKRRRGDQPRDGRVSDAEHRRRARARGRPYGIGSVFE